MAHYNAGIARDRLGRYPAAVDAFSAAIALEPHNADFYHVRSAVCAVCAVWLAGGAEEEEGKGQVWQGVPL